jgi:hypothetical protein
MSRITIMSGPIIHDTGDRWSHKHVSLNGRLFFTHSTILADLYSRRMVRDVVCAGDICEITSFPEIFSCEDGIKRGNASLIRQMATHLSVLCYSER